MRNTLIASMVAGAVFAGPAFAQDDGMAGQPPVEAPGTAEPEMDAASDPMAAPVPQAAPDAASDPEVVAGIDPMAQTGLTPDQQAQYDAWPTGTQSYYSGLTADRQELFWLLKDNDKIALSQLPEAQQAAAWEMIDRQVQGAAAAQTADGPTK